MRDDITNQNPEELSYRVFNDGWLYSLRLNLDLLIQEIGLVYHYTEDQLDILLADIITEGVTSDEPNGK